MKRIFNFIPVICCLMVMASCHDDEFDARTPEARFTVSDTDLEINQTMTITFDGVADQVVIYTGDDDHDYSLREVKNDYGLVVNKGLFTYSYSVPGVFHVVCLAVTYDTFSGANRQTDTYEFDVTVTDDVTTIDNISSSITPNVFYAVQVNDDAWVMSLPQKQVYNNKEIAIKMNKCRLTFDIPSDSTVLKVDGELYAAKNYYDLTKEHDICLISNAGTVRHYTLYTLIYPEFTSVKLGSYAGKLQRSAYDQDLMTYVFDVPDGTDASTLNLDYKIEDDVVLTKVSDTEYTLVRSLEGNKDVKSTSRVRFEFI